MEARLEDPAVRMLACAALLLAACGGSGAGENLVTVRWADGVAVVGGMTWEGQPTVVEVSRDPEWAASLRQVVTHELIHAAGVDHLDLALCQWTTSRGVPVDEEYPLCAEEMAALARGGQRTYVVRVAVGSEDLWPAVVGAVEFLNREGPFPLFALEPAAP